MATAQEVGRAGEAYVVEQLHGRRFKIQAWDPMSSGAAHIEALGGKRHVLVQVKTGVAPNDPQLLNREEAASMKVRAVELGAEPWQARVTMNADLTLKGTIAWRRVR